MILRKPQKILPSNRYMYIFSLINVLKAATAIIKPNYYCTCFYNSVFLPHLTKKANILSLRNRPNKKNYNAFICKYSKKYKMSNKFSNSISMNANNENEKILNENNVTQFNKNSNDVKNYNRGFSQFRNSVFSKQYTHNNNSSNNNNNSSNNNNNSSNNNNNNSGNSNNISSNKSKNKMTSSYISSNSNYVNNNNVSGSISTKYTNNSPQHSGYFSRESGKKSNEESHSFSETKLNVNTSANYTDYNIKDSKNYSMNIQHNHNGNSNNNNNNNPYMNDNDVNINNFKMNNFNKEHMLLKNAKDKNMCSNNVSARSGSNMNTTNAVNGIYQENSMKNFNYKSNVNEKRLNMEGISNNNNITKGNERFSYLNDNYPSNMKSKMKNAFSSNKKNMSSYNTNLNNAASHQYSKNLENVKYMQKNYKGEISEDIMNNSSNNNNNSSSNNNNMNNCDLNKKFGMFGDPSMNNVDMNNMANADDSMGYNDKANSEAITTNNPSSNTHRSNSSMRTHKLNSLIKNEESKRSENFENAHHDKDYMYEKTNNLRGMMDNSPVYNNRNRNKMISNNYNAMNTMSGMFGPVKSGSRMNNVNSINNLSSVDYGNKMIGEHEKGANSGMNKNTRNISYENKTNNYNNDMNKLKSYEAKKNDYYGNYASSSSLKNMNIVNSVSNASGVLNKMDDSYNGNNINRQSSLNSGTSSPNLDADAFSFYDFNDFLNYMYKDENILTLFYIRKNYLKAESREEFVNEDDKIKYSIIWTFANDEKIAVSGTHNTKKLSKKVCVKKILLKLKNISLLELDQMTKWMINSLNVILKVEHKNMENKLNTNNNIYCSNIEWKVNNKMYQSTGVHAHEKIAEIIATQKLYMLLYDIKDQLIKETEYMKMVEEKKGGGNMHVNTNKMYENNNNNNNNVFEKMMGNMGGKYDHLKGQGANRNFGDNMLYKNSSSIGSGNHYNNAIYRANDKTSLNADNPMLQPGVATLYGRTMNNSIDMSNVINNAGNMNFANSGSSNNNNIIMSNMNDKMGAGDSMNGLNNAGVGTAGISDPSELITYSLTKQDASSIQMLRNNIASRYKIHQTENFEQVYNLYKCTLEWEWKNGKVTCKSKSVGYGSTKSLAKCEAAYDMLVKNNLIEYVSSTDRKNAQYIRDLISKDLTKALNLAVQFIIQYSSSAWSIFLIFLLRELLIDGNYDNINRLLNTLVEVSKEGRIEVDNINKLNNTNSSSTNNMNNYTNNMCNANNYNGEISKGMYNNAGEEVYTNSSSNLFFCNPYIQNKCDNSNYVHKLVSIDLWEKLIDECVVVLNDKLCFHCITLLQEVELDYSIFISKSAHDYYKKYRIMLALELQANLAQSIQEKRDFEYLHENKSLLLKMKSITLPILSFTCTLTTEEKEWMKSTQMREDDIVLLKPCDQLLKDEDAWSNSLIGSITSTKSDNTSYNINVRIFSAENTKKANVKYTKYKLYLLLNIVTHERMLQALRSITFIGSVPTQYQSPYVFTPEIRFLILHTYNKHGKFIAQNGKLNEEIADYEKIKMDFHNNESLKNPHDDILREYSREAKNPYEDLLNEALNKQIGNTHVDEIDQYLIESINLPTNLPLNDSQKLACLSALTRRLTLVQGPPGTGKTHVACAIIDSWHRQNSNKKILAVADSNVAANNLVEGLKKRNIQAVRVGAGSDSDFHEEAIMEFHRYKDLLKLRKNNMQKEAKVMKALLFLEAVKKYNVVIATCVGSGHEIFDNEKFERVIIDECAQSIEPSNLIPLGHYCNNLVLIGDHKQLPPTIISPDAIKLGLDKSLLERFVMAKIAPVHLLTTQRRMHLSICTFPNFHFYDNKLKTANVTEENRPIIKGFLWPNPKCRLAFIDVSLGKPGSKFENAYGTSKFNLYEIEPLISVLKSIINEGCVSVDEIGILTAYDAQKMKLKKAVQESFPYEAAHRIEIDSIDGFQGKEKDLILFSAVRSNANNELGFLRDARRLNVMLTRAKRGVILFGDQYTLANDEANWLPWLKWITSKRAVVHITKLNEHLENADYSLLDKLNKINKAVNLKNVTVSDNYYFYGNDTGFSNDYSDPNYNQIDDNNFNSSLNDAKEEVEQVEEIVENWEDLL
ncbi:erythrocyte membrane-associated antigen, putative [Plasmodium malariae]|uniref:Erythrocyte membrane-associated antigen, putative n=1 Tax=Plasmodium malariae TaxID=5858 RepID=A0A1D3JK73_PLAMA|nr:erythrocyte membrane-associated antigen, putative [Plasmodium malariae]SBT86861.1 erythrocyte membrane-associated antigen, putative [Plasmodium malariae]